MKIGLVIFLCLVFGQVNVVAQQLKSSKTSLKPQLELERISFSENDEVTYQTSIASGVSKQLSYQFNFRMEDELVTDATYVLWQDIIFFDVQVIYTLGKLQLGFFLENLFGLNDTSFAIEPNLDRSLGVADTIYFSHEANFLVGINMAYQF